MTQATETALKADNERDLKTMICPQCKAEFQLTWNDWDGKRCTLEIRGCPSGGIYDVLIQCPECDYKEAL